MGGSTMSDREDLRDRLDELETSVDDRVVVTIRDTVIGDDGEPLPENDQPEPIVVEFDGQQ